MATIRDDINSKITSNGNVTNRKRERSAYDERLLSSLASLAENYTKRVALLLDKYGEREEEEYAAVSTAQTQTAANNTRGHQEEDGKEKRATAAHITDLDSNLQEAISRYVDIHQWDLLRHTCTLLSLWPKPPPPSIKYHLIKFYFYHLKNSSSSSLSNGRNRHFGYCGVAKTLPDVIEAYKHECSLIENINQRQRNQQRGDDTHDVVSQLDIQFLHVGDLDFPLVPLIEFEKRQLLPIINDDDDDEHRRGFAAAKSARVHRFGKQKMFDVKEAGGDLLQNSTAKRMMGMALTLNYSRDCRCDDGGMTKLHITAPSSSNEYCHHSHHDGEAAMRWFEGMKPIRDIDLNNLCFVDESEHGGGEGVAAAAVTGAVTCDDEEDGLCEIWLFRDRRGRTVGNEFTLGRGGGWAVCDRRAELVFDDLL
mmetsp:Transcript_8009/g.17232  ORF Transcript_8009/g.17232 Transcript_8009/m.17232 type:complete len:423 (+) Transcript_8009:125-1393(+)